MKNYTKPLVILFDVNETLLDMGPLKASINKLLDNDQGFKIWFGMLLQHSLVDTCINEYHDFTLIANGTLSMAAKTLNRDIDETEKRAALSFIRQLDAYPDVPQGLPLLKDAGFRLATLTNSPLPTLLAQLEYAGIQHYFEKMLSIDVVKKYKPAIETYEYAAQKIEVAPNEIIMVAAHGWDIAGALNAGLQAAFVERKGQSLYPLSPLPQYIERDMVAIANAIIKSRCI
jgi:2-haloacid dehalogenase